ncbi:MAG: hypothetical protein SP1CHLAM54_14660 [Chlamydiia bacterium]|nr:hypothetical protein [Chlamydiia bacterium]MCH9616356.1 hypothetical protein [Chlamydiia bacterium]MCH9629658.1 hypothetical protein [Chlamydiia bacterium]
MDFKKLKRAREELTDRYREGKFIETEAHRKAYKEFRLPATSAVIKRLLEDVSVETMVDLGAGQGASLSSKCFEKAILIERDRHLVGQNTEDVSWKVLDFTKMDAYPECDLILASYSLNEVKWGPVLEKMWAATNNYLLVVEPGTPEGSARICKMRERLLEWGAYIVGPCTRAGSCPMPWCHFSERVDRSSIHRRLKDGKLSYEDEKYAYIFVSKTKIEYAGSRVVRHPKIGKKKITFTLCSESGLEEKIITKSMPEYKIVRKKNWGDVL